MNQDQIDRETNMKALIAAERQRIRSLRPAAAKRELLARIALNVRIGMTPDRARQEAVSELLRLGAQLPVAVRKRI